MIGAGVVGSLIIASITNRNHFSFSAIIAGSCMVSAFACIPIALIPVNGLVLVGCFFVGVGFGNAPALFAQIGAEAPLEVQGRVQGFNYAVMTVSWALGPFAYWYAYICMCLLS
jgi:predicted MFS family arabinose efflux permease